MTTLPDIAAMARRMADRYGDWSVTPAHGEEVALCAARDIGRLADRLAALEVEMRETSIFA